MRPAQRTYTVVTSHFGDQFWIEHLLTKLVAFGDERIREILVIDQSRESGVFLSALPGVTHVLEFERDSEQIASGGHDHPASLDKLFSSYPFTTSHVIVFDSDAFPTARDWLNHVTDVTLAEVPGSNQELSHPAFMVLPTTALSLISFSENFLDRVDSFTRFRFDTGRLVALQLRNAGYDVFVTPSEPGFSGFRGDFYLGRRVYHHGHGSHQAGPEKLQLFISESSERLWRKKISKGDMSLHARDYVFLGAFLLRRRIRNLLAKVFQRLRSP